MPTYTVHAPPPKAGETESGPERFVFVRDGFHFWAFLLGPLWLLAQRLWLVLAGYVAVLAVAGIAFYLTNAPGGMRFVLGFLFALLIGMEAASLRRWTLTRRGWRNVGFVVGDDAEAAERRFFGEWVKRAPAAPAAAPPAATTSSAEPHYATPVRRGPPSPSDVIGLFPEPGNSR